MATTANLTGPQYRLMSNWYKYYQMVFTYVVEDRNDWAGTTTIRYSIFMDGYRVDNLSRLTKTYYPGDNIDFGVFKPYYDGFPVITHWYTAPTTGNTFTKTVNTAADWTRAEVKEVFNGGDSAYCRVWLVEDVYLVISDLDTYNLSFRFSNSLYGYDDVVETVSLGLDDYALITSAPTSFSDEDSPIVYYANLKGSETKRMDIGLVRTDTDAYLAGPYSITTGYTAGTYTFNFTTTEREAIYAYLANSTRGAVQFRLRSEYNGKVNISTGDATLYLVAYSPVLDPTIVDTDETTLALTGDNTKFIKGHSRAEFTLNATGRKGAYVISYETTHNGAIYRNMTGAVNNIENDTFVFSATDTRGITTKQPWHINLLEYYQPTCALTADLPTNDDTIPVTVSGKYWNGDFGAQSNTVYLYYRWKTNNNDSYTIWEHLSPGDAADGSDSYYVTAEIPVPNHVDRYTVQVKAVDKLSEVESRAVTVQSYPVFDWSDQDFNFNVPVAIQDNLNVAGTIYQNGNPIVDYVVDQGTSGIWTFRKWASGIAECWGTVAPAAHSITSSWGNIFTKDNAIARQTYPFSFKDVPVVSINLYNTTGNCWAYTGTVGSTLLSPAFGLARGTSGSVTVGAQITAIGRWK